MTKRLSFYLAAAVGCVCFSWGGLALDPASQEASKKTQDLLKNKNARDEFIQKDPKAQKVQQNLNNITTDPQMQQEIYDLAADLLPKLIEQANGDVSKLQEIVSKAAENPASFANQFTPEQRERLKLLAEKLQPASQPTK